MDNIKSQFPLLKNLNDGDFVYLDSAATSQKPKAVIDSITNYYTTLNANVHRGVYDLSARATNAYEEAHQKVADFINASSLKEVIFTRNATEGLNLLANTLVEGFLKEGDVIVITEMEHHSNIVPWQIIAKKYKLKLEWIPVNEKDYSLDLEYLDFLIRKYRERIKLISFVHVSNVLGTLSDVESVVEMAKSVGAMTILDAAQSIVHMPIDVQKLGVDFLVFSGHKMYAPTGIGVLWGREALLEEIEPWMGGGEMISKVWRTGAEWNELPWKFEAGTPNISGGIALGSAIDWINENIDFAELQTYEKNLLDIAVSGLKQVKSAIILGDDSVDNRHSVLAFTIKNIHPHDIASLLDEQGIAVRAGYHCVEPLHKNLDFGPSVRISVAAYNTESDIHKFLSALLEGVSKVS